LPREALRPLHLRGDDHLGQQGPGDVDLHAYTGRDELGSVFGAGVGGEDVGREL
jgi:hypothetical protein